MKFEPGQKPDVDTLLKEWPAPSRAEPAWDVQADSIASAISGSGGTSRAPVEALLAAPELRPEPGEPGADHHAPFPPSPQELRVAGERKMSDDKDQGPSATPSQSKAAPGSEAPRSKRQSLREIAERARSSTPGPGRVSSVSTPLPGAVSTPIPPAATSSSKSAVSTPLPRPATSTPIPSRPVEAGKEDSGVVDLNTIRASATPQQVADAEKAKPGSEGLFDDDKAAVAAAPASSPAASKPGTKPAAAAPAKKKGSGAGAGIAIAAIGIAAAAAFMVWKKNPDTFRSLLGRPPAPIATEAANQPTPAPEATAGTTAQAAAPSPGATGEPGSPDEASPVAQNGAPRPGGPVGAPWPGRGPAPSPAATADPKGGAPAAPPGKAPEKGGDPGSLAGAMEKAVGPTDKAGEAEKGEPASGSKGSSSVPEQPPQGSVSAAVGSVMGGAKACVAGADDVSRATITFGSNGSVSSVSVTGWAAAHGATGCVKSALQGAKVGAFSKPSFSVGVTIRP